MMRLDTLPGWVIDNDRSVREEVAPYVGMSMAARWRATRRCCRSAMHMLRFHRDPAHALDHRDAIPESTRTTLARLREQRRAAQ